MATFASIQYQYDGEPNPAPEDANRAAQESAERIAPNLCTRFPVTLYAAARGDNDMPEGPWLYTRPGSRGAWRANFAP